ncbi:thioesterase superfamily protein [Rhypophila decipiens]|uniref:Thioesterase superfamily protein n=1 Tax=Rhypophila decipiens TaxID=261697 RepID=A0AAN6Y3C6_9PEZI|nr:thioesterase superfamily protein [Rhypophila decipiens]
MSSSEAAAPPGSPPSSTTITSDPTILSHLQNYHATRCTQSPIYTFLLGPPSSPLFKFTHASKGLFLARMVLKEEHLNVAGGIHGSVSATIVDWAGGLAVASYDLRNSTGVSVDINVSYLSSAKLGDEVEIEGKVEKVGSTLAFTEVRIWKVEEGKRGRMVISGRHTKYVKGSAPK